MELRRLLGSKIERPALFLALAAFAPLAVYASFNGYISLKGRQTGIEAQAIATARSLSENIDREINSNLDEVRALAAAPALDPSAGPGGLKVIEEVMRRTRSRHPEWVDLTLMDPQGVWLFSANNDPLRKAADSVSLKEAARLSTSLRRSLSPRRSTGCWRIWIFLRAGSSWSPTLKAGASPARPTRIVFWEGPSTPRRERLVRGALRVGAAFIRGARSTARKPARPSGCRRRPAGPPTSAFHSRFIRPLCGC
jgi:hypothetical protein